MPSFAKKILRYYGPDASTLAPQAGPWSLVRKILRYTGWASIQLLLVAVILGLIAAMWIPLIRQWTK